VTVGQLWGRLAEFGMAMFLAFAGLVYVVMGDLDGGRLPV
jgi:hypothetical protein